MLDGDFSQVSSRPSLYETSEKKDDVDLFFRKL